MLFTKSAVAGTGSLDYLHLRIYWHGGGDEIQNKAEAQPAWLQLAVGAAAGSWGCSWQLGLN